MNDKEKIKYTIDILESIIIDFKEGRLKDYGLTDALSELLQMIE